MLHRRLQLSHSHSLSLSRPLTHSTLQVLAEETKQLAEATYMKKRMYYNMRIKTLRRNTTNALRRAQEGASSKVVKANVQLSTLIRHLKEVEREIEDIQFYKRLGQVRPSWVTLRAC